MLPPDQGLHRGGPTAHQVDARLVDEIERPGLQRAAQVGLELEALGYALALLFREEPEAAPTPRLALVEGRICRPQQGLRVLAVVWVGGDADGSGDLQLMAADGEGRTERLHQARGDVSDLRPGLDLRQQHDELVAAVPRHHVLRTQRPNHALGHAPQYLVTRLVAERVVDQLEAVQVEEQDGQHGPAPLGLLEHRVQVTLEHRPRRQAREVVVLGPVCQLVVEPLLLDGASEQQGHRLQQALVGAGEGGRAHGQRRDHAIGVLVATDGVVDPAGEAGRRQLTLRQPAAPVLRQVVAQWERECGGGRRGGWVLGPHVYPTAFARLQDPDGVSWQRCRHAAHRQLEDGGQLDARDGG